MHETDVRNFDSTQIDSHMVAGTIREMIEKDRRAMNMLDIPNPTLVPPSFIQ